MFGLAPALLARVKTSTTLGFRFEVQERVGALPVRARTCVIVAVLQNANSRVDFHCHADLWPKIYGKEP
jgi:hypothetical protein